MSEKQKALKKLREKLGVFIVAWSDAQTDDTQESWECFNTAADDLATYIALNRHALNVVYPRKSVEAKRE